MKLFVLFAILVAVSGPAAEPQSPNILLILADDLGACDLGCYGADLHETPALDRLGREGVLFRQAYAPAPVCTPTRASLLTGKHPARLRMTIWSEGALAPTKNRRLIPGESRPDLPLEEVTLAERLHEAGYATGIVGKWHLGDAAHAPETQGFDVSIGGTQWGAPQTFFWPYRGTGRFGPEFRYVPGLPLGKPGDYLTDALTDEALRFMDAAQAQQRPFFLLLAHHAPHTPIEAKTADVEHFQAKLRPEMRHQNSVYAAMVKNLDDNVGRVLAHLDQRGLAQNTLVIFTSDNGGYIGIDKRSGQTAPVTNNAPLRSGKGSLYEGGIRVPLLVRWPGVTPAAAECTQPVWLTDLFPTLAAVGWASNPSRTDQRSVPRDDILDGLDLTPLLRDPSAHLPRDTFHWHYPHYYETTTPVSAIRVGRWKLLEYFEQGRFELFDLEADPREEHDLASQDPERVAALAKQLAAWRDNVQAALPKRNADLEKRP